MAMSVKVNWAIGQCGTEHRLSLKPTREASSGSTAVSSDVVERGDLTKIRGPSNTSNPADAASQCEALPGSVAFL
jgi:hypothetical protein